MCSVKAQTLKPGAYANAPAGMNFLLVGYKNFKGALLFDSAVHIIDANTDIDMGLLSLCAHPGCCRPIDQNRYDAVMLYSLPPREK